MSKIYQGYDSGGIPDDWKPTEIDEETLSLTLMKKIDRQQRQINWLIEQLTIARAIRNYVNEKCDQEFFDLSYESNKQIQKELKEIE